MTAKVWDIMVVMTMTDTQIDYENPWIFDGAPFLSENIDDLYGFVYCITNTLTGRQYIGRKYFWQHRKLEVRVGELRVRAIGKNTTESSDELNQERKQLGNLVFKRDILSVHKTKGRVNYEETRQLFINNVLTETVGDQPRYYNSNILGRYMRKDYFKGGTCSTEDP